MSSRKSPTTKQHPHQRAVWVPNWSSTAVTCGIAGQWQSGMRHCCIEPKGVLATAQNSKMGSIIPMGNHDELGIRSLPRGIWAGR